MQKLSALDASFVYLESDHSPMHIGCVYLIDAGDGRNPLNYEAFATHVGRRLQCSPVFRRRLVEVPLSLSHPCWINDPDFDLARHLPRLKLPPPGGKRELMQLSAQIFGRSLDRNRPLWEMCFVEGLDRFPGMAHGSVAVIIKVHHAAVDGASAMEWMGTILDPRPLPRKVTNVDDWEPEPLPGVAKMVAATYARIGRKSAELASLIRDVTAGALRIYRSSRAERTIPPPFAAPDTILNGPVASSRTFWAVDFELERVRQIRLRIPGATVNDVLLAVCAAGLRDYLLEQQALPDRALVAMVPVSVRRSTEKNEMGNQLSGMRVSLSTDIDDPVRRLLQISVNTRESKLVASALPANRIAEFIPSESLAAVARLYARVRLGGHHRPFFNLFITNVPGPKNYQYLAGARVTRQFGMAPIIDGLGLILVALSYAGRLSLSITSCYRVIPDPDHLGALFERALGELEKIVVQMKAEDIGKIEQELTAATAKVVPAEEPLERLRRATEELDRAIESLNSRSHQART